MPKPDMTKFATLILEVSVEGVSVAHERASIPLSLLDSDINDELFAGVIKQNVLKLMPSICIRDMDVLRRRVRARLEEINPEEGR